MQKIQTMLDVIPGCDCCMNTCRYNGMTAASGYECGGMTDVLYGCNSARENGKTKRERIIKKKRGEDNA